MYAHVYVTYEITDTIHSTKSTADTLYINKYSWFVKRGCRFETGQSQSWGGLGWALPCLKLKGFTPLKHKCVPVMPWHQRLERSSTTLHGYVGGLLESSHQGWVEKPAGDVTVKCSTDKESQLYFWQHYISVQPLPLQKHGCHTQNVGHTTNI